MRTVILALAMSLLTATASARSLGASVRSLLRAPGVRLVAVEFYASWCKPCQRAIPRWRALKAAHRDEGLRVVLVATQDPDGGCQPPGFTADKIICDEDGAIARAMGVERLPAAYLWSFDGALLVERGHVEAVEQQTKRWLAKAPRVQLDAPAALRAVLEAGLAEQGKLPVVASARIRKKLDALRRESFKERYDESLQCELGRALPANALLTARRSGGRTRLRLLSAERSCVLAAADSGGPALKAARRAIARLHRRLQRPLQKPASGTITLASRSLAVPEEAVQVRFSASPKDAIVLVDGQLVCASGQRPCTKLMSLGEHTVEMQRVGYEPRRERIIVEAPAHIDWTLRADHGWLTVQVNPADAHVLLDGQPLQEHKRAPVNAGAHALVIKSPCHADKTARFSLERGEHQTLRFHLEPKQRKLQVQATDHNGRPIPAQVFVRDRHMGQTPARLTVPVCAGRLRLTAPDRAEQTLDVPAAGALTARFGPPRVKVKGRSIQLQDSPRLGPEAAKVNLVLFGDLLCPGSQKLAPALLRLQRAYKDEVRLIYKHNPQPFRAEAEQAHLRAISAGGSGFWPRFASADRIVRADRVDRAPPTVRLSAREARRILDRDQREARRLRVHNTTPVLFIGDRKLTGARSYGALERAVQGALGRPQRKRRPKRARPAARGALTVEAFVDYECPHSARALRALDRLRRRLGPRLQVRLRHRPLAFHKRALPTAKAVLAAERQGALWAYQAKLLERPGARSNEELLTVARALDLDEARFAREMHSDAITRRIERDLADASAYQIRATPTLLINGQKHTGHTSYRALKQLLEHLISAH